MAAVAIATGHVKLTGVDPAHLTPVTAVLRDMGCGIEEEGSTLTVSMDGRPTAAEVVTRPWPGFPTDMQAQVMAACAVANGTSFITETIYIDRFTHVAELVRLGADIRVDNARAAIFGVDRLQGAPVMATVSGLVATL